MKVILTDDVIGVGEIGQTVTVRPGFARNFLIPRGLAFESETAHGRVIAHRMRQVDAKKRRLKGEAGQTADRLRNTVIEVALRIGSGGKVFGSIGQRDIATKLKEAGVEVDRRRVLLAEPLRKIGTHYVRVKLHPEVEALVKVEIGSLEVSKEEEEKEVQSAREALEKAVDEKRP